VTPGRSMSLKDVLLPERLPVLVREKTGSKKVLQFDLIATRIVSMEDHFVLSDSVYLIPRRHGLELIGDSNGPSSPKWALPERRAGEHWKN
jgi:hypothetical protein